MGMSIGDRMKRNYEYPCSYVLTRRIPVVIRLDGKCFHTFTRKCRKPFDDNLSTSMEMTAKQILRSIQGAKIAYTQSDEISILITDYDTIETDAWFGYNVQKMCSVSASICTALFNTYYNMHVCHDEFGFFDSRVFNIPKEEVVNYFIWRQQDCMRNSVQMCAQYLYSQKQLNGLNVEKMKQMLMGSDFDWNILQPRYKYGTFVSMLDGSNDMCESHDVVLSNKNMFDKYLSI